MQEEICVAKDVKWKEVKVGGKVCPTKIMAQAEKNFPQGMSLEEINEEIRKARSGEEDLG